MEEFGTLYTLEKMSTAISYPTDEAERFAKQVKPLLVGQKIQKILSKDIAFTEIPSQDFSLSLPYEIEKIWENPLVLEINDMQLKINLDHPLRYALNLGKKTITDIVDINKAQTSELYEDTFVDISAHYTPFLNLPIKDFYITKCATNNKDCYVSSIVIAFENNTQISIYNSINGIATEAINSAITDTNDITAYDKIDCEIIPLKKDEIYGVEKDRNVCAILLNGQRIDDILAKNISNSDEVINENYVFLTPTQLYSEFTNPWWFGRGIPYLTQTYRDKSITRHTIMSCPCGEPDCDAIGMKITKTDKAVIWHNFTFLHHTNDGLNRLTYRFKLEEYDAFLQKLKRLSEEK